MGMLDDLRAAPADSNPEGGEGERNFAPAWRWEHPLDGVEGTVVAIDRRVTDNHPDGYPIVTLRQEDGTDIAVHALHTVLKDEVEKRNLRVGDIIAVVYDGKKASSGTSGRSYHAFRMSYQPGTGSIPQPAPAAAAPPAAAPQPVPTDPWLVAAPQGGDIPPF